MAFPLPPAFRKKMAANGAMDAAAQNPLGVSESDDLAPNMKGEKPNPLKAWAQSKLVGAR